MKKRMFVICISLLVITVLLSTVVSATGSDYEIDIPKDYTVGYKGSDVSRIAVIVDEDEDKLEKIMDAENLELVAANRDNSVQIHLAIYETAYSKSVKNISALDSTAEKKLASDMSDNEYTKVVANDTVFLKSSETLTDEGGRYASTQFITVRNGKVYHLVFYTDGEDESPVVNQVFNSFKIKEKTVFTTKQKVIIVAVISALAVLICIMAYGIIKEMKE